MQSCHPAPHQSQGLSLRVAQIATVGTPVRQDRSDSIESLAWLLARELTALGHEVTTFAAAGSDVAGELVATIPGPYGANGSPDDWHLCEWINLCRAVAQSERFDVLHSHAYLWGIPLQDLARAPLVHTLHVTPYEDEARLWRAVPGATVTGISHWQWAGFPDLMPAATVYHGIDPQRFTFRPDPDDYLCFLGRFIPGKGPLEAIRIARSLGRRLLLAGPENEYYREQVAPHVDGRQIEYVGCVSGKDKDRLLGGARALLYPVQSPEPFGLVLVEAMMCGTPVAAIGIGAVPEVIDTGLTGFYTQSSAFNTQSSAGLAALVPQALALDRAAVRQRAITRFSARRMALEYVDVYQKQCAHH